jgi:uncharacterized protein
MLLRKVELDFSDAKVIFAPDQPEYCHLLNGISSPLHHLENFLMKTVRQAREQLPADAPAQLVSDVDIFCQQEGWHARLHAQFNKKLISEGYFWLEHQAERLKNDFDRFLESKGPLFCLAYAEGFETFGPLVSSFFFEEAGDLMQDWDEPTVYLWLWHFAEEYEHRTVCNHLYGAVYGRYWPRIYGLWYSSLHLFGYAVVTANTLIKADLLSGRIGGSRMRSRLRMIRVLLRFFGYLLPRLIFRCMSPTYNPATIPPPKNCLRFLDDASTKYTIREPS